MKLRTLSLSIGLTAIAAAAQQPAIKPADSLSVAVGTVLGEYIKGSVDQLATLGAKVDPDVFLATMAKVVKGQSTGFTRESGDNWIDGYIRATRPADLPDSFSGQSQQQFLSDAAALPGAVTTPSGLVFIVEQEGEGAMPADTDRVQLMYTGRFYDGTVFDATGSPISFGVNEVTPGFSEGLKLMKPGGRYRIVMPASLGYGPDGIPGAIPGNAALDFTVELISIL